ncbi:MAG: ribosome maturation factor RimM [Thermoanaerobaculia bacterium]
MRSKFSTTEGPSGSLPEAVLVGTILRPHGIKGEVTVALWSDYDRRFAPGVELQATAPAAPSRSPAKVAAPVAPGRPAAALRERLLRVERAMPHKGGLRVAFAGIADREAAESLRGLELWVPLAEVPEPPPGTFYVFELIGCRCFDERDGDIGTVVDIQEDGGGTLLEVEKDGRRVALPFVEAFLVQVDRAARRIDLRLPEGLLPTCAYRS